MAMFQILFANPVHDSRLAGSIFRHWVNFAQKISHHGCDDFSNKIRGLCKILRGPCEAIIEILVEFIFCFQLLQYLRPQIRIYKREPEPPFILMGSSKNR